MEWLVGYSILFCSVRFLFLHIINDYAYAYAYAYVYTYAYVYDYDYAYTYAYAYDYDSASDYPLLLALLWSRALLEALEKAEKLQISETYARHYD